MLGGPVVVLDAAQKHAQDLLEIIFKNRIYWTQDAGTFSPLGVSVVVVLVILSWGIVRGVWIRDIFGVVVNGMDG